MKLVAISSFNYNTRRLNPGDPFEAKDPDGRLLIGVRKARKVEDRKEQEIPAPRKDMLEKLSVGGLTNTKIPTYVVGEIPSEQIAPKEKVEEIKNSVSESEEKENATLSVPAKEDAEAKKEVKEENKESVKEETPVKEVHTRGRRKN